jgi:hypothetical protein
MAVTWLLNPCSVLAQSRSMTVSLSWERGPGAQDCVDAEKLARDVEERLRRPVFSPGDSELILEGEIGRGERGEGFITTMRIRRKTGEVLGERTLSATEEDCSAVSDSISLIAALMVDLPQRGLRLTVPQPEPSVPPPRQPRPTQQPRTRLSWGLGAALAVGLHPDVVAGGEATFRWSHPGWIPFQVGLTYWFRDRTDVSNGGGVFDSGSVGLHLCPALLRGELLELDACLGVLVGATRGRGFGFDRTYEQTSPIVNAAVSVPARLRLTDWLALELALGVDVPFVRDQFLVREVDGTETAVHRASPAIGTGHLSLVLSN